MVVDNKNQSQGYSDKYFPHANKWYVCIRNKIFPIKGMCFLEVLGYDWIKVIWEVVGYNVVNERIDNYEIGL